MTTRYYWWLVARDPDPPHRPYLVLGSDKGEDDARQHGMELLPGVDFQIRKLPTKDLNRASSMVRGKRLESTHSLKKASQRQGHEKSIVRDRKRRTHKQRGVTQPDWL